MEIAGLLQQHKEGTLSYTDGVALFFELYPEKRSALESFFEVEDQHSRAKLHAGLDAKVTEFTNVTLPGKFEGHAPKRRINVDELPPELRKEYAGLSPLIRRISHLHARLFQCFPGSVGDKQRYDLACDIIKAVRQRRAIFNKIDNYLLTGRLPDQDLPAPPRLVKPDVPAPRNYEVEHKLQQLRVKRSKLKKRLPHRQADYDAVVKRIAELSTKRYAEAGDL